jgi:hypothetical protein
VLYRHFIGPQKGSQDPILSLLEAARVQRQAQLALEGRVDAIQRQVGDLVELRTAALRVLGDVPRAEEPAAPLSVRDRVNMLVRSYASAHGVDYEDVRGEIYRQFYHRYGFDAHRRAKNAGISKLDAIERARIMEALYKVASEVCS